MTISIIAAVAANGVIGRNNALPWHLPEDLKRFKALTMGHPMIMGRRTYESIGRPLPGRKFIVVSRRAGWSPEGVLVAHSLAEAIELAHGAAEPGGEIFIAGGAGIFREGLACANRMYLTHLDAAYEGDTWFPPFDEEAWRVVREEAHPGFRFVTYERKERPARP